MVTGSLFMRSFEKIDDVKMEFSVQITFRQQWYDNRLEYDDMGGKIKYLTMTDSSKVWMPDTFFQNEKLGHFHDIIVPNVYVRIFPTGRVLYSIRLVVRYTIHDTLVRNKFYFLELNHFTTLYYRISLTLACPMDLKLYPLDRQECEMRIASCKFFFLTS